MDKIFFKAAMAFSNSSGSPGNTGYQNYKLFLKSIMERFDSFRTRFRPDLYGLIRKNRSNEPL
jgi:hypothetical protein